MELFEKLPKATTATAVKNTFLMIKKLKLINKNLDIHYKTKKKKNGNSKTKSVKVLNVNIKFIVYIHNAPVKKIFLLRF